MSEAMTNSEIEDVLSSIRRLVAQEARPAPERLVLTPEQRVAQANLTLAPVPAAAPPAQPAPEVSPEAVAEPAPPEPAPAAAAPADVDRAGLEATISELEAALGPVPARPAESAAPEPDPAQPDLAQRAAEAPQDSDFALIDEDDLQRLIARLVREELRGQLGEKITLQVRKLVRAEIARALDERSLLG